MASITSDTAHAAATAQILPISAAGYLHRRAVTHILVRPGDKRLATYYSDRGGIEWQDCDDDGEVFFFVIGRNTSDESCRKVAGRYGLVAAQLIAFRQSADASLQVHPVPQAEGRESGQ